MRLKSPIQQERKLGELRQFEIHFKIQSNAWIIAPIKCRIPQKIFYFEWVLVEVLIGKKLDFLYEWDFIKCATAPFVSLPR